MNKIITLSDGTEVEIRPIPREIFLASDSEKTPDWVLEHGVVRPSLTRGTLTAEDSARLCAEVLLLTIQFAIPQLNAERN